MSGNKLKEIFESNVVEKTISGEMKVTPDKLSFLYQIGWYCAGPKQKKKRRVEKNGNETDKARLGMSEVRQSVRAMDGPMPNM